MMDKFVLLSKRSAFGCHWDTIWGYVTSEENAKMLCESWSANGNEYYYIKNLDHDGGINLDQLAKWTKVNFMAMGNFCYTQGIECPYATTTGQCRDNIYDDLGICEMLGDEMPPKELAPELRRRWCMKD